MRMTLNAERLDLLEDVLAYYVSSGMGGGDRDTPEDRAVIASLQRSIEKARERDDEAQDR